MRWTATLTRHRRLLALGALSLLVHLAALDWIGARDRRRAGPETAPGRASLALRLREAAVPAAPVALPPPAGRVAARSARAPAAASAPRAPAQAAAPSAAAPEPAAEAPLQMPGRYRARLPPAASLTYAIAGQAGAAHLDWHTDGERFTLRSDGVTGSLRSSGATNDAGVAPELASEIRADGGAIETRFARRTIAIDGREYPNVDGSQDRASVLLQLMGMGLAEPDQLRGTVDIYLAGRQAPEILRLQVMDDDEELATGLGPLATRHLVQVAAAGETRLEIWLAPQLGWAPVQLRTTAPGGAVATQTVTRIDNSAP